MMKRLYQLSIWCLSTILLTLSSLSIHAQTLEADSLALVDLYNNCGGTNWVGFDSWLNGPISTWEEVTVDPTLNRVTHVGFKNMELTGTLPNSLGNMDEMRGKIEIHDDEGLTGELPAFLWKWTKVERFQVKRSGFTSINTTGLENMINLTEFNTEATPIAGTIPGVIFTLPNIEKLYFHDSEFDAVPSEITQATSLTRLYLNGDNLKELPDMSGMTWGSGAKVRFHDNQLTFEDLEPLMGFADDSNVAEFRYSPQANVGEETYEYPAIGAPVSVGTEIGGTANVYQWIKGEEEVSTAAMYEIAAFDPSVHSGKYFGVIQNTNVPGLVIMTEPTHLYASEFAQDSLALVDLYNNCGGAEWSGFDTWLNGPLKDWEQVTVDEATQRVTNVGFRDMHLRGALPETLGNITKMSGKIEMRDDSLLTGALPSFLWRWVDVERFQIKFSGYTSIETEGLENMVNLTEFNTEGTPIAGTIPGVIFTLPNIDKLYFHDSEFDALPPEALQVSGLTRLYLNGDNFSDLPDMSGMTWGDGAKVRVHNNFLTFEDLEQNIAVESATGVAEFRYSPQANVGEETYEYPALGAPVSIGTEVGGTANVYQWIKGEEEVSTDAMYEIAAFDPSVHSGKYFGIIQNTTVPGLVIMTEPTHLYASEFAQDSLALVDLYNKCGGTEWSGFDTWLNGPLKDWEQVTLDSATQRVTNVGFRDMHLTGALPETLGNITKMSGKIEMRDDSLLTGALPAFLWRWVDVERFQIKFSGYTSIETEGLENMVNLTEFNTEGTPIAGTIPGVIFTLPNIDKLYFHDSEFDALPPEATQVTGLTRLYLNGDNFSDLPDMSGMTWGDGAKVRVHDNFLTFEDLEQNIAVESADGVAEFRYSPQANVGEETYEYPATGAPVSVGTEIGGTANVYQWIKGEEEVSTDATYEIASFDPSVHSGKYFGIIQNTIVPGLVIMTEPTHLYASEFAQDSLALVDLYNNCGGTDWEGFGTWLNGPLKDWEQVTLDSATQRVTNVGFRDMHLTGALPETLGNITKMSGKIEMRDDSLLTGALPAFLWRWVDVERFQIKFSGYTSIETEGLENMVNLTEFNTEGTPIAGTIPGVIFTLPNIDKLYFHDSEFDALPPEATQVTGLTRLYLNGDNFSDLPDMSGMTWGDGAKVRVHDNFLTFEDLEQNVAVGSAAGVEEFRYSPQANIGEPSTIELMAGETLSLSVDVGGTANTYTWIIGEDEVIDGATAATYEKVDVSVADAVKYRVLVQNELVPGLDLFSEFFSVIVDGVSGTEEQQFAGLRVLGNPVANELRLEADEKIEMIRIVDVAGKLVKQRTVNSNSVRLQVDELQAGVYFVVLSTEGKFHTIRMVKK